MKTIRLIYPQWQGAQIGQHWIPEITDVKEMSQGYVLGSQLLQLLAPPNPNQEAVTVPVDMTYGERKMIDGVTDRDIIVQQTRTALDILRVKNPDRIITLGGECSVSVVPFTYLTEKYDNDVAVLWIDAHPDITLPGDTYSGYHAMTVTALMGKGDKKILSELPATIPSDRILLIGIRDWEREEIKERQKELGIKNLTNADVKDNSDKILSWLRSVGAKHVLIHFDLDVLDPAEIIPAVGIVSDGLKMDEVVRIINDVATTHTLDALTVAEPMPRRAIQMRNMLNGIDMFK